MLLAQLVSDGAPEATCCHDICFVSLRHLLLARARQLKRHDQQATHLSFGVVGGVHSVALGRFPELSLRLAEIGAGSQLTQDDQVHAAHDVGLQGRGIEERLKRAHRAQIGEEVKRLAQPKDRLFGAHAGAWVFVELGRAHGAEQHSICFLCHAQRWLRQRCAVCVDSAPAYVSGVELEIEVERLQDAHGFGAHFGADAVAGEHCNAKGGHGLLRL